MLLVFSNFLFSTLILVIHKNKEKKKVSSLSTPKTSFIKGGYASKTLNCIAFLSKYPHNGLLLEKYVDPCHSSIY
jgi:hypothetical protein